MFKCHQIYIVEITWFSLITRTTTVLQISRKMLNENIVQARNYFKQIIDKVIHITKVQDSSVL